MPDFITLGIAIRKILESIADSFIKSPLEEDFGEASEFDIELPGGAYDTVVALSEITEPLIDMFNAIDGLDARHVKKLGLRLHELPHGRTADYRYQVKDAGAVVELQVLMRKADAGLVDLHFRSSDGIIEAVMMSFGEDPEEER